MTGTVHDVLSCTLPSTPSSVQTWLEVSSRLPHAELSPAILSHAEDFGAKAHPVEMSSDRPRDEGLPSSRYAHHRHQQLCDVHRAQRTCGRHKGFERRRRIEENRRGTRTHHEGQKGVASSDEMGKD